MNRLAPRSAGRHYFRPCHAAVQLDGCIAAVCTNCRLAIPFIVVSHAIGDERGSWD